MVRQIMAVGFTVAVLAGCGGSDESAAEDVVFEWEPCSWSAEKTDALAECASVQVPLDGSADDTRLFRLGVKRRRAPGGAGAQLWVLAGGPGDAATEEIESLARGAASLRADLDIYAVDHRGTGGSERLACTASNLAECGEELEQIHGERLAHMSSVASARDLAWLIDQLTPTGTQLFIYGGSYGTYLAQRYIGLYPERANGVILEGIARAERPLSGYDRAMNEAGQQIFERCAASSQCSRYFAGHPLDAARLALAALDAGTCAELGMSAEEVRELLASAALATELLPFVPALARRIARCTEDDVRRVRHFAERLAELGGQAHASPALGAHVAISELLVDGASTHADRLLRALPAYIVASGLEASLAAAAGTWPAYSLASPPLPSSYRGPLLMLQGGLDPASPVAGAAQVAAAYTRPLQALYVFPDASHNVIGATATRHGEDCARLLYAQFLAHPEQPLDDRCMQELLPIDFEGADEIEHYLFGGSAWD